MTANRARQDAVWTTVPGALLSLLFAIVAAAGLSCNQKAREPHAVGTLERDRIELIAEEQEPILEIPLAEGASVHPGELIVVQDDRRLAAQLAAAEAAREAASAELAELLRGTRREEIEEARARLSEAESAVAEAAPELERMRALFAQGVESSRSVERAEAALGEAQGNRDAALSSLTRLLNGATREELDRARARVAEAEATAEELRVRKERLRVTAPRSAVIDALPFEVGERPPPGATVAVLLAEGAPYARIYVPAESRPKVQPGTPATVKVEGLARDFAGRVRLVSSEAAFTPFFALTERDRGRLAYLAEVDLIEPEARSLPTGLPVEVELEEPPTASPSDDD